MPFPVFRSPMRSTSYFSEFTGFVSEAGASGVIELAGSGLATPLEPGQEAGPVAASIGSTIKRKPVQIASRVYPCKRRNSDFMRGRLWIGNPDGRPRSKPWVPAFQLRSEMFFTCWQNFGHSETGCEAGIGGIMISDVGDFAYRSLETRAVHRRKRHG